MWEVLPKLLTILKKLLWASDENIMGFLIGLIIVIPKIGS
jgi:hypothetical protein